MILILVLLLSILISAVVVDCSGPFDIYDESSLEKVRECPDSLFRFTNNVQVKHAFTPIPSFTGTIEGQNYHLAISEIVPTKGNMGLFQTFAGTIRQLRLTATIKNLHQDTEQAGLFAGVCDSTSVTDITVVGTITCDVELSSDGAHYIGGFAGSAQRIGGNIESTVNLSVKIPTGNLFVGGVLGGLTSVIEAAKDGSVVKDITYSGEITIGALGSSRPTAAVNAPLYVGGVVAKSEQPLLDFNAININVTIWAASLQVFYGGIVATQSRSILSSFVTGVDVFISDCGPNSYIGGAIGDFLPSCVGCATVENSKATYNSFIVRGQVAGSSGFVAHSLNGDFTRCIGMYNHLNVSSPSGGFVGIGENVRISECAIHATNYTATSATNLGTGGFVALLSQNSLINNSYILVENFTMDSAGVKKGGFAGEVANSIISNSFLQFENATLVLSSSQGTKLGFFVGHFSQSNAKTSIERSYIKISKFNYKMEVDHMLDLGGFITEAVTSSSATVSQQFYVKQSWMDVSLYLDFSRQPVGSNTCLVGLVDLARYGMYISDFYGRLALHGNIISFKRATCMCVISQVALFQSAYFQNTIFNFSYTYTGDAASTPGTIYIFGEGGPCTNCDQLIIARNQYLESNIDYLCDPAQMRTISFYSARGWTFGESNSWSVRDANAPPVLTALPYILRDFEKTKKCIGDGSSRFPPQVLRIDDDDDDDDDVKAEGYTFYFPTCLLELCWDYTNVWHTADSPGHGELIWTTQSCSVKLCSMCDPSSQFVCKQCSGGRLTDQGQCQVCQEGCIACPESVDICTKCADPGFDVQNGVCVNTNVCLAQPNCLLCNVNDKKLCERCTRGYWLNRDTNKCMPCPSNCYVCTADDMCTQCAVPEIQPVAGSCNYSPTCADTTTCLFCRSEDPTYCLVCIDNSMTPNVNGMCVSSDILYCYIERCSTCLPNNPYRCSVCKEGSYVSSLYGICMYCEKECKQCTEQGCMMCTDPQLLPIKGTCLYTSDCNISNCKFCGGVMYSTCLQCVDGYLQNDTTKMCEKQNAKNSKGVYIAIFITVSVVGISVLIAIIVIRVTKRLKCNTDALERVRLVETPPTRTPTTGSATPSRTFYAHTPTSRDSAHELTG